jgi:hypothetical protein
MKNYLEPLYIIFVIVFNIVLMIKILLLCIKNWILPDILELKNRISKNNKHIIKEPNDSKI